MNPAWLAAFASVLGNGHKTQGLPCQDACAYQSTSENSAVAVVCDGAGSCENAAQGAKKTVEFALSHFVALMRKHNFFTRLPSQKNWQRLAQRILLRVREDLKKYGEQQEIDFNSLSCTLIVVLACPNGLLVTHIGDGRAGYCNAHGEWLAMLTPFKGEETNQTVFMTSAQLATENNAAYMESRVINEAVNAFCVLSDGCERASYQCNLFDEKTHCFYDPNLPYPQFFNPNLKILQELHQQHKTQTEINTLWADFLATGTASLITETDDKTLILAVRHG